MAAGPEPSLILSFEEARAVVEHHAAQLRPHGRELVELLDSAGRVLAEPIAADRNLPPFPRAIRDGYAVRAADLATLPACLRVVGEIKAGAAPGGMPVVEAGHAAAIMTGAPAPSGADAVVMVEYTSLTDDTVTITRGVQPGENIVPTGSEAKRGARLLSPGTLIDHGAIAVAASAGRSRVLAYAKPRVAVLSTGDEVVDVDVPPGPHQIRNSNSYSVAAQIQAAGGEPTILPIAPDRVDRLRELISEGLEADLLLITGGVSMGKYDLVEQVLGEWQPEFLFTGVRIQPGKPTVFGRIVSAEESAPRYFFGLPGNPVSTMVTFELFARSILDGLTGRTASPLRFLRAKLKSEISTKTGLTRFLPAILSGTYENVEVALTRWQGSGDIAAMSLSNCYLVIPPDRETMAAGEWVPVMMR
jgi:molybdopterin molybdotransferase